MRVRSIHLALVAGIAALSGGVLECGKIPCAVDDSVCGEGGRCNQELGVCEAIPAGEVECDIAPFGEAPGDPVLVLSDLLLTYDGRDDAGCLGVSGNPYNIYVEVDFEGPLTIDFSGDELFFSADGVEPVNCVFIQSFQVLNDGPCDGSEKCFVLCSTCFEQDPSALGVQLREDDGSASPLSLATCVDVTAGLVDEDCDGLPDFDEGFIGTDPANLDSDGDGVPDGVEKGVEFCGVAACANSCPLDQDVSTETNPVEPDSDNDGLSDGTEDTNGNGRVDADETDPNG